jgi:hypothetical protein
MIFGIDNQLCRPPQTKAGERRSAPILQFNKVIANGRLHAHPRFVGAFFGCGICSYRWPITLIIMRLSRI